MEPGPLEQQPRGSVARGHLKPQVLHSPAVPSLPGFHQQRIEESASQTLSLPVGDDSDAEKVGLTGASLGLDEPNESKTDETLFGVIDYRGEHTRTAKPAVEGFLIVAKRGKKERAKLLDRRPLSRAHRADRERLGGVRLHRVGGCILSDSCVQRTRHLEKLALFGQHACAPTVAS